jgi:cold shock CspA family protein
LDLEPGSAKVRYAFGYFELLDLNDPEAALVHFKEGLKIEPDSIDLQLNCVRALLYSKRFEEARSMLDSLQQKVSTFQTSYQRIKLIDQNLQYYMRKADYLAISCGEFAAALENLETLLKEFDRVPAEWVDDKMRFRMTKAILTASKCVREIGTAERERANRVLEQLCQFEPISSTPKDVRQGSVSRMFRTKGFGFISTEDGKELFFGLNTMLRRSEWYSLSQGVQVEYQIGQNKKGACAVGVRIRRVVPATRLSHPALKGV